MIFCKYWVISSESAFPEYTYQGKDLNFLQFFSLKFPSFCCLFLSICHGYIIPERWAHFTNRDSAQFIVFYAARGFDDICQQMRTLKKYGLDYVKISRKNWRKFEFRNVYFGQAILRKL